MRSVVRVCETCKERPEFVVTESFIDHMDRVHGIHAGEKCTRKLDLHLDVSGGYSSTYTLECKGVKITEVITERRISRGVRKVHPKQKVLPLPED